MEDPITTEVFPFDEAVSLIKRSRRKLIYLHVGTHASYRVQNPAKRKNQGEVFCALIPLTRRQVLQFLDDAFALHHRPKLSLYVSESKRCMFVGSSPR